MYNTLINTISKFDFDLIPADRLLALQCLVTYIKEKITEEKTVNLNFICIHNSRRSHLSQIWAQTASYYYDIASVVCYSGGTEATAMFPVVVNTLRDQGFQITALSQDQNPIYAVKYDDNAAPIVAFSKLHDSPFNPKADFAAVMTCSEAEGACPNVSGASVRIPITYEDPKVSDGTDYQLIRYAERSIQIATEMFYVFHELNLWRVGAI